MKTNHKNNAQRSTLNAARSTTAEQRSLAASRANWTRAVRRAFPDGGPRHHAPETLSVHVLNYALARKAWARGQVALGAATETVRAIRAKQLGRERAMAEEAARELARLAKGGAK